MLLKDYVEGLTKLLKDDPEYGELEVWTYTDAEGNSILPMYEGSDSAFVEKGVFVFAWFFSVVLLSATTALSVYILTNILNFA